MRLQPFDLRRRLYIIFRGEEGLDYGGLARYNALYSHVTCTRSKPGTCHHLPFATNPVLINFIEKFNTF